MGEREPGDYGNVWNTGMVYYRKNVPHYVLYNQTYFTGLILMARGSEIVTEGKSADTQAMVKLTHQAIEAAK